MLRVEREVTARSFQVGTRNELLPYNPPVVVSADRASKGDPFP